jgi:hypothetical protein
MMEPGDWLGITPAILAYVPLRVLLRSILNPKLLSSLAVLHVTSTWLFWKRAPKEVIVTAASTRGTGSMQRTTRMAPVARASRAADP